MTFDKIVISSTQPGRNDIVWAKPVKGGFALYLPFNGRWQPLIVMDDEGTVTPEDDKPADISEIPELIEQEVTKQIGTQIEDEVTRQMAGHDASVHDTHNAPSADGDEYPDIHIL